MTEKGWPWDSIDADRPFGAQQIANACASVIGNGVVGKTDFQVTPQPSSTVTIGEGEAWIDGRYLNYGGGGALTIAYGPASSSSKVYGLIVLRCDASVPIRGFLFDYKLPKNNQDATAGDGEIAIAKVRYNRGTQTILTSDIIRATSLATPINGSVNIGAPTNIEGLVAGAGGGLRKAVPGADYMPVSGGNFTGPVSVNGKALPCITQDTTNTNTAYLTMPGTHIVKYSDGRMTCSSVVDNLDITTTCVQSGSHTVFVADSNYGFGVSGFVKVDNVNLALIGAGDLRYSVEYIGMTGTASQGAAARNIEAHYWGGTSYSVGDTRIYKCGALLYVDGWWK